MSTLCLNGSIFHYEAGSEAPGAFGLSAPRGAARGPPRVRSAPPGSPASPGAAEGGAEGPGQAGPGAAGGGRAAKAPPPPAGPEAPRPRGPLERGRGGGGARVGRRRRGRAPPWRLRGDGGRDVPQLELKDHTTPHHTTPRPPPPPRDWDRPGRCRAPHAARGRGAGGAAPKGPPARGELTARRFRPLVPMAAPPAPPCPPPTRVLPSPLQELCVKAPWRRSTQVERCGRDTPRRRGRRR